MDAKQRQNEESKWTAGYWALNLLLIFGCLLTFGLLGGCKEPKKTAGVIDNQDQVTEYYNNRDVEVTPPSIKMPSGLSDAMKDTPTVNAQMGVKF